MSRMQSHRVSMFPPYTFINLLDFLTAKELVEYEGEKAEAWRKYFEWKKDYKVKGRNRLKFNDGT
jgi:hypothetical protein